MIKKIVIDFDNDSFIEAKNISCEGVDFKIGSYKEPLSFGTFSIDDIKILKRSIDFIERELIALFTKESISPNGSKHYNGF